MITKEDVQSVCKSMPVSDDKLRNDRYCTAAIITALESIEKQLQRITTITGKDIASADMTTRYIKETTKTYVAEINEKTDSEEVTADEWTGLTWKYTQCLEILSDHFVNIIYNSVVHELAGMEDDSLDYMTDYYSNPETYAGDEIRQDIASFIVSILCNSEKLKAVL